MLDPRPGRPCRSAYRCGQVRRRDQGSGSHNRPRNFSWIPILSAIPQKVSQLWLGKMVHQISRRRATSRIHAHIQRAALLKTKSSLSLIHLRRGNSQIQQKTIRSTLFLRHTCQITEIHTVEAKAICTHLSRQLLCLCFGSRIHIQSYHTGSLLQKGTSMTPAPKRRVIHRASRSRLQHGQDLLQKNRDVFHALGCGTQPEDFPSDGSPEADDFIRIAFRKLHHPVTLDSSGTVSAARKAACEFSPHHLLPVHILPPGTPEPIRWNVPPGRVLRNQLRESVVFLPPVIRRSSRHRESHRPLLRRR